DVGNLSQERRQAQNAADAASLAGVQDIASGDTVASNVVQKIKTYLQKNFGTVSWAGCRDGSPLAMQPDAGNQCISWDAALPNTTRVRVVVPVRSVATFFGKAAASVSSFPVSAHAVAVLTRAPSLSCALCTQRGSTLQNGNIVA